MNDKCEHCRFWRELDATKGHCIKNAPSPVVDTVKVHEDDGDQDEIITMATLQPWARWPITAHIDLCGEYKHKHIPLAEIE